MKSQMFTYRPVTIDIAGQVIELEVSGEIDAGGKIFLDLLYYKAAGSVYSTDMHDLLKIQTVFDSIANQIKGRK
jgi:hypothetical protein